jgi:hypothetical protein
MAVNDSQSMNAEFAQGTIDRTYIQLTPNRCNVENPPVERLTWPAYRQVEQHRDFPFGEASIRRSILPMEYKTSSARNSDPRY